MKHTIVRAQPVQPPVQTILLELTPEEMLMLAALVNIGHSSPESGQHRISSCDWFYTQSVTPASAFRVTDAVNEAARAAGLVK